MDLLLAFILAAMITMTLVPPLARAADRLHVVDVPGGRKAHSVPIPAVGGLAMAIGSFVPLLLWLPIDRTLASFLAAAGIMVAFGVWDDRVALGPWTKLLGQLLAVMIVVFIGHVEISSITLTERVAMPQWIGIPLTVLFLLGVTNAINLSDGLDGLAGGTTLLSCGAIALLAFSLNMPTLAVIALVFTGSILGFLRFNTYPARIFMGDGGSQFLGFSVGVLSIMLTQNVDVPLSAGLPLLLLGLPILDTVTVMALRIRRGESPMKADRSHLHHKLLALGFDHHEAVILIYVAQCLMFLSAWLLRFESDLMILGVFSIFAALIFSLLWMKKQGWRFRHKTRGTHMTPLLRLRKWLLADGRLSRWSFWIVAICAGIYAISVAAFADAVPLDVGWLALALAAVLGLVVWRRAQKGATDRSDWLAQGALYVAVVAAVYLDHQNALRSDMLQGIKWVVFPLLAVAAVVWMRFSGERRFRLTSLDTLLIFAALAVPNLPGVLNGESRIGLSLAKLIALFYAVEMVSSRSDRARQLAWTGALAFCAVIALHTFMLWA